MIVLRERKDCAQSFPSVHVAAAGHGRLDGRQKKKRESGRDIQKDEGKKLVLRRVYTQ